MQPTIREARVPDATAIGALSGQLGYPQSTGEAAARLASLLEEEGHAVYVAEENGDLKGFVHVFEAQRVMSAAFAELGGFVVDEACRGRGIGSALMARAEMWSRERGHALLRVRSNVVRADAHRFYDRLGFAQAKQQGVFQKRLGT